MNSAKGESGSSQDNAKISVTDSDTITEMVKNISQNPASNINIYIGCSDIKNAASGRDIVSTETGNVSIRNVYEQKWDEIKKDIDLSLASEHLRKIRLQLKEDTDTSPEKELAICYIAAAEDSAKKKDGASVLKHLQKLKPFCNNVMYPWAITFTAGIAVQIAAPLIKAAFQL